MTELMNQHQVAELLGVTPGTLANWRSSGAGPRYVKPVGKVKYRKSDVEAFIDTSVVKSTCDNTTAEVIASRRARAAAAVATRKARAKKVAA